ncbi:MAG: GH92 family glycosyl hydrolase [Saprospiraceae bacterium]
MKERPLVLCLFFALFLSNSCGEKYTDTPTIKDNVPSLTQYVNPFMGTANHGHVYPGATVPFGMVQLSPDNGTQAWDWCSGYNWISDTIVGFSHTHLSGTGIGDLYDISIMPTQEIVDFSKKVDPKKSVYAAKFSHKNENAKPGFYQVKLDNGIDVKLTASERVGFHDYNFPKGKDATLLIDLAFAMNWDSPTETHLKFDLEKKLITGYRFSTGWAKDQRVFFAAEFSEPIENYAIVDGTSTLAKTKNYKGKHLRTQLFFGTIENLKIKVGLSTADEAGAIASLKEIPNWNFNQTKKAANDLWEKELSKIVIQTPDEDLKKIFYTSLYRTCLAPVKMSDANGNYKGADHQTHTAKGYNKYGIFSLWDTFRAANPLYTIIQKNKVNDFVKSLLSHYEEYGLLPVWSLLGNETNTMTGYHAIPVIVDAYLKGYRDFDAELAFKAMKKSAAQDIRGTNFYRDYGYIPYDKAGQSVTRTLEYAYDDWCIAQMAKALGKEKDYQYFLKRAKNYEAMFDASTGFMRAKYANEKWKTPFDPQYSDHNFDVAEYTEGNAWQHSWFTPHAPNELIQLHGGNEKFILKLDSLFTIDSEIKGDNASSDISGLIGQYAHGNEPSHHIAYFYNFAGKPHKTQEIVRKTLATQYNSGPTGLCGNEDCGQMSAWYVFSAMGFYPFNPADGKYVFGSPLFEKVEIPVKNNNTFTLIARNASAENKYIKSVKWNGADYDKFYISHEDLMSGGMLEMEMSNQPNH